MMDALACSYDGFLQPEATEGVDTNGYGDQLEEQLNELADGVGEM